MIFLFAGRRGAGFQRVFLLSGRKIFGVFEAVKRFFCGGFRQ